MVRFRRHLEGRVLELGCGAGRLLGYLSEFGGETIALDISPHMVQYAGSRHPTVDVRLGDIRDPGAAVDGRFDVIFASDNVLDVLDDAARRETLAGWASHLLAPGGVIIFSSHNLDAQAPTSAAPAGSVGGRLRARIEALAAHSPAGAARRLRAMPARIRNRRRFRSAVTRGADYAILNDDAHDFGLLHYYIGRDAQERQLSDAGLALLACLDGDGGDVLAGSPGAAPSLYYVASAAAGSSAPGPRKGPTCQTS